MLKKIYVKNFATIDFVEVDLCDNLNILTGETGAGKSIIIESINFLFGRKQGTDFLRTGENEGYVSAVFETSNENLVKILGNMGLEYEEGEDLIIKRDISCSGKSRYFINGEPVTRKTVGNIYNYMLNIFGQHDKTFLFDAESQIYYLDVFAKNNEILKEIKSIFAVIKRLEGDIVSIRKNIEDSQRITTLNSYIISDVEELSVSSYEDEVILKEELKRFENINNIREYTLSSIDLIEEDNFGLLKSFNRLRTNLSRLSSMDYKFAETKALENAENAAVIIEDILFSLQKFEGFEFDEGRFEEIKSKLDKIIITENKYNVSTLKELMELYDKAKSEYESGIGLEEKLHELEGELGENVKNYKSLASMLHERRTASIPELEKSIESELMSLKIKPVFKILLTPVNFDDEYLETGLDKCVFMFSANPGEEPRSLSNVASGGELSRLSLCLLKVMPSSAGISSFIFDEIDSGIGGDIANYVGEALKALSYSNQVILITHLAQVASFADRHFSVSKEVRGGRTFTEIKKVSGDERVAEIARMLSGDIKSEASILHAKDILKKRGING